ncbi:MAG: alpha/beta hydrolase [Saprospiraceae bacterium]|nr:alpha/beta hydrolase [Saprospiraceae bacterium]
MLYYKRYLISPDADWVVFIHGAGGSSAIWYKQIKYFQEHFNLLLIDLRGHGKSAEINNNIPDNSYSFEDIANDIIRVLDHLQLKKAHFVGVSLGTIIIRQLADMATDRIQSMVMVGAITNLNLKSRFWVTMGRVFKNFIPYMWLYRIFAFVIMPSKSHKESRSVFISEAQKLCQKEFLRWFTLTGQLTGILKKFEIPHIQIPTLYVMGEEDYLFLAHVRKITAEAKNNALMVVEKCGHVVNIEKAALFNEWVVKYLKGNTEPEVSLVLK